MAPRACSLTECRLRALALSVLLATGCRTLPAPEEPAAGDRPAAGAPWVGDASGELPDPAAETQAGDAGEVLRLADSPTPERDAPPDARQARAERAFQAKDFELAYGEYLAAVNSSDSESAVPARTWLRLAQIALYEHRDEDRADYFASRAADRPSRPAVAGASTPQLSVSERELLERLRQRLSRRELSPAAIGLGDGNVSALRIDGDDLWIGTWNGGVCRYTLASGETRVFREGRESLVPATVRCIEVTPARVWIGTYQGLYAYSKAGGAWQEIGTFGGPDPRKVEALRVAGGRLYAGTLGQGLWRQDREGWSRISSGPLPGDFVTCLEADGEELLIGTLTQGVVRLNLGSLALRSFDPPWRGPAARNITMLLADPPRGFWIGTYGLGAYYWDRQEGRLSRFDRAGGQLGDDWVLCAVRAASGTYFGTLGGGLARLAGGDWRVLGFREGVPTRDVPALAYSPPFLYLGSLGAGVAVLREEEP